MIILLSLFSCKDDDEFKKPSDVKPIDWENYNTVYDTYWNFADKCREIDPLLKDKTIKVMGYIHRPFGEYDASQFMFIDNPEDIYKPMAKVHPGIYIHSFNSVAYALRDKFDTVDLTKKCYLEGKLIIDEMPDNAGCTQAPGVFIINSEDVIFK